GRRSDAMRVEEEPRMTPLVLGRQADRQIAEEAQPEAPGDRGEPAPLGVSDELHEAEEGDRPGMRRAQRATPLRGLRLVRVPYPGVEPRRRPAPGCSVADGVSLLQRLEELVALEPGRVVSLEVPLLARPVGEPRPPRRSERGV